MRIAIQADQCHRHKKGTAAFLVTVTVGLTAMAAGIGNAAGAQIAETGELFHQFGAARLQILKESGTIDTKKKVARGATLMSHIRQEHLH
jgi:hypothetical protein